MTYRERLWPAPWVWVACLLIASTGGLVVIKVASVPVSLGVAAACVLAAAYGLVRTSSVVAITVTDDGAELVAGRAHIPVRLLGTVEALSGEAVTALRGPRADARAYLFQRGWIATGVRVVVDDPQDPTPYWFVSSRTPDRLVAAIEQAVRDAPAQASPDGASVPGRDDDRSRGVRDDGEDDQAHSRHTG